MFALFRVCVINDEVLPGAISDGVGGGNRVCKVDESVGAFVKDVEDLAELFEFALQVLLIGPWAHVANINAISCVCRLSFVGLTIVVYVLILIVSRRLGYSISFKEVLIVRFHQVGIS